MSTALRFAPRAGGQAAAPLASLPTTQVMSAWSCTVRLVVADERVLHRAADDLTALLARVDAAASRFRPDSALSIANARAGRPVPVPRLLVELVDAALDAAVTTDGAVDPTLGLAMHRIGYDRDISDLLALTDRNAVVSSPAIPSRTGGWRSVRVHREAGLLTVPTGTALDLGATAKAWTADHAAETLAARYNTAVLVELGGDMAVAGDHDWLVRVAEREGADGQVVTLHHGGLTTSTTTVRTWTRGGASMHHIVDPRSGRPADGPWRTASVAARSALVANTASTAAIVLGAGAVDWLETRGLAARLVGRDGAIVTTAAWPAVQATSVDAGVPA